MPIITIIGMKKGIFNDTGHAAITVDGSHVYDGRATWKLGSFDITDTSQRLVIQASSETKSKWHAFLGHGSRIIRDAVGAEIARISYAGLFGFRRTTTVGQNNFRLPQRSCIELPEATISVDRWHRSARADVHSADVLLPYLAIAFDLWLSEETSS